MEELTRDTLRTRWHSIDKFGYPPRDNDPFYRSRYSVPVLAGNEITGQVAMCAFRWCYEQQGWVRAIMDEGTDPCDYEVQHVTHWALWPKCKLICKD